MKIKVYVNTGFAGAKHVDYVDVPDAEWKAMNESEREAFLDNMAEDFMGSCIEYGAYPVEEEDDE